MEPMDEMEKSQFRKLQDVTTKTELTSGQSPNPPTCSSELATRRAGILLGCYRKGDAEEPEIYSAAVASVLAEYPQTVAYKVTDPRSGLPGKSQWLPTVAEVKAACEVEMAPLRAEEARRARREHTARILSRPDSSFDRVFGVSAEQWAVLKAKFPSKKARKFKTLDELKALYDSKPLTVSTMLREKFARQSDNGDNEGTP